MKNNKENKFTQIIHVRVRENRYSGQDFFIIILDAISFEFVLVATLFMM